MLETIRNSLSLKIFWGILAVYCLNISVDTPDSLPNYVSEDLSINDQESIIEILLENVLGIENAIPEVDDNDTDGLSKNNTSQFDTLTYSIYNQSLKQKDAIENSNGYPEYVVGLTTGYYLLNTPPPKV